MSFLADLPDCAVWIRLGALLMKRWSSIYRRCKITVMLSFLTVKELQIYKGHSANKPDTAIVRL
jgi:hypothetical protein